MKSSYLPNTIHIYIPQNTGVLKLQDQFRSLLQSMKLRKLIRNMKGITTSVTPTPLIKCAASVQHI